jgi:hypothetical protein
MFREMITLPFRAGVCATRLAVHITARAAGVALGITRLELGGTAPEEGAADARESSSAVEVGVVLVSSPASPEAEAAPATAPAPADHAPEPVPAATSAPALAPAPEVRAAPEIQAAPEIPPAHISEGLQFVEAFAEPGAEEGAGAAVHVREPWRGYSHMTANEVIGRLVEASPEELAAVALYEGVHRRRKTVLAEARRRLQSASASQAEPAAAHVS